MLCIIGNWSNYAIVAIFLAGLMIVTYFCGRDKKNATDYLLGNRQMPWLAVMVSMVIALFSAVSFVAIPGEAYANGLRMWLASLISAALIPFAMWMFLSFYYNLGSFTPYEYLERRFSSSIRLVASILFIITRYLYLAIVLYASAKALEGAFGWKPWASVLLIAGLAAMYTTIGGIKAIIWIDIIQFFVLTGGVCLAAILITMKVKGGIVGVLAYAFEHGKGFNFDRSFLSFNPYERVSLWLMIIAGLGTTLSYYATDQLIIQKLLSTKSYSEAKRAVYMKIPFNIIFVSIFWFIGIALFAFYHQQHTVLGGQLSGDNAFAYFINNEIPAPLPGLIMAGLLAASITTLNAGISGLSTVAIKDIYTRFFNREINERVELKLSRIFTALVALLMIFGGLVVTWISDATHSSVLEAIYIWQSFNSIILGMFVLGVTSTKVGTKLLISVTSIATVSLILAIIFLYYRPPVEHRISFIIIGNLGLIVTVLAGHICSAFNKKQAEIKIDNLTLFTKKRKPVHEIELNTNVIRACKES